MQARQTVLRREFLLGVHARLTDRDWDIVDVVGEHQVFTLDQLQLMFFPSRTRATVRLSELRDMDVLDRFRSCRRPGSQRWRYTLGHVGATIHAHRQGQKPPRPSDTMNRISTLASSRTMRHQLGVNQFVAQLVHEARLRPDVELECLSERNASVGLVGSARPDARVRWREDGHETTAWIEYDTGTEPHTRLLAKVAAYGNAMILGERPVLLFLLHSAAREAELQTRLRRLEGDHSWIATTLHEHLRDPAGPIWWPADGDRRVRLVELSSRQEAENRSVR